MLRRLFTIASAASLLAFLAVMTLWVRSYFVEDWLTHSHPPALMPGQSVETEEALVLTSRTGTIRMHREKRFPRVGQQRTQSRHWVRCPLAWSDAKLPGWPPFSTYVRCSPALRPLFSDRRGLAIECWFLALLTASLPACWLISRQSWRRRWRTASGLCPACGYDIRACTERCSECGEPLPPGPAAAPATRPSQ